MFSIVSNQEEHDVSGCATWSHFQVKSNLKPPKSLENELAISIKKYDVQ